MSEWSDVGAWADSAGDSLIRLAFVLTNDGEEARDVVQAVLLKMMRVPWESIENPLAYARRSITNEVASRGRRRVKLRSVTPKLIGGVEATIPDTADAVLDRQQLMQAMERLSVRQRTVLVLRYFEDLDDRATAEILGCSTATVRSVSARALTKLRKHMSTTERWPAK